MNPVDGQLAFDFDEFAREDARRDLASRQGAPLHFTTDYYAPGELDEAFELWCFLNGTFGSVPHSHMWHRPSWAAGETEYGDHSIVTFTADLSPPRGAAGPGDVVYRASCEPCEWHKVDDSENGVVEAWHDHAVPGWRELPVIPAQVRVRDEKGLTKLAKAWISEHYPQYMQVAGAPIITERTPHTTRHVPGYSPWRGYDLSWTALDHPSSPSDRPVSAARRDLASAMGAESRQAPQLGADGGPRR